MLKYLLDTNIVIYVLFIVKTQISILQAMHSFCTIYKLTNHKQKLIIHPVLDDKN